MNIDTFFQPSVPLRGQGITARHHVLLMITVYLPHGVVLQSIDISIDPQDPNKGFIHVDISPSLNVPETHFSQAWIDHFEGNPVLAEMFCDQLQSGFERDDVSGSMMLYRYKKEPFRWPKGQISEIMSSDPYTVYFRGEPTPDGESYYDIKEIDLEAADNGTTVPAYCVYALFYSAHIESRSTRGGRGLTLPEFGSGGGGRPGGGGCGGRPGRVGGPYGDGGGGGPYPYDPRSGGGSGSPYGGGCGGGPYGSGGGGGPYGSGLPYPDPTTINDGGGGGGPVPPIGGGSDGDRVRSPNRLHWGWF
jgi:hypothetical protein